ncbi:MAG TPA: hypothetical protein VMN39_07640 [Longimicrobiaceae bacterium]|nr:hypothetical protein [Longimicrobiaceae bacterium]
MIRHHLVEAFQARVHELAETDLPAAADYIRDELPKFTEEEQAAIIRWSERREAEELTLGEEFVEEQFEGAPAEIRRGFLAGCYEGLVKGAETLRKRVLGE